MRSILILLLLVSSAVAQEREPVLPDFIARQRNIAQDESAGYQFVADQRQRQISKLQADLNAANKQIDDLKKAAAAKDEKGPN